MDGELQRCLSGWRAGLHRERVLLASGVVAREYARLSTKRLAVATWALYSPMAGGSRARTLWSKSPISHRRRSQAVQNEGPSVSPPPFVLVTPGRESPRDLRPFHLATAMRRWRASAGAPLEARRGSARAVFDASAIAHRTAAALAEEAHSLAQPADELAPAPAHLPPRGTLVAVHLPRRALKRWREGALGLGAAASLRQCGARVCRARRLARAFAAHKLLSWRAARARANRRWLAGLSEARWARTQAGRVLLALQGWHRSLPASAARASGAPASGREALLGLLAPLLTRWADERGAGARRGALRGWAAAALTIRAQGGVEARVREAEARASRAAETAAGASRTLQAADAEWRAAFERVAERAAAAREEHERGLEAERAQRAAAEEGASAVPLLRAQLAEHAAHAAALAAQLEQSRSREAERAQRVAAEEGASAGHERSWEAERAQRAAAEEGASAVPLLRVKLADHAEHAAALAAQLEQSRSREGLLLEQLRALAKRIVSEREEAEAERRAALAHVLQANADALGTAVSAVGRLNGAEPAGRRLHAGATLLAAHGLRIGARSSSEQMPLKRSTPRVRLASSVPTPRTPRRSGRRAD